MVNNLRTKRIMAFGDNDSRDGGHHVASSTNYKMRPLRSKWNRVVLNANYDKGCHHMASQPKRRTRKRKLRLKDHDNVQNSQAFQKIYKD